MEPESKRGRQMNMIHYASFSLSHLQKNGGLRVRTRTLQPMTMVESGDKPATVRLNAAHPSWEKDSRKAHQHQQPYGRLVRPFVSLGIAHRKRASFDRVTLVGRFSTIQAESERGRVPFGGEVLRCAPENQDPHTGSRVWRIVRSSS
ncbi:hypothetical protein ZHAS_00004694 [Anopheles sinensis]|uniref:Uncharacterized protein n=1 Tax=Anopheles sinensis TaxID=74873 RepID=A0A084VHF1_ANOSI|nr:hypothetical protein ZHAS_00004694 [Anopheles sinensis]